ncbi:PREDICTED: uncharacterized protein LOC106723607 isoform X1 [Myotis brandtii]|uniref:uncharacterized protein LOC106723607 isoform X1 n=1 Tax=Myotis brandtii TaxID=109478 RepID=UPI0007047DE0|nr:PREDICTED: uncharacterized protein LOC106723607 isoform X1 [Myotis brandtii]
MTSLHLFLQNPSTGVCLPPPLETTASRDLGLGRAHRKHSTSAETKSLQGGMTCSRHLPMELASTQHARPRALANTQKSALPKSLPWLPIAFGTTVSAGAPLHPAARAICLSSVSPGHSHEKASCGPHWPTIEAKHPPRPVVPRVSGPRIPVVPCDENVLPFQDYWPLLRAALPDHPCKAGAPPRSFPSHHPDWMCSEHIIPSTSSCLFTDFSSFVSGSTY